MALKSTLAASSRQSVQIALTQEQLYSAATIITSSRDAINTGAYNELADITSLKNFVATFAAHIAADAARD